MVLVPRAEVTVGSPLEFDENPVRTVRIETFLIDVFPTTNAEYLRFVQATAHRPPKGWPEGHVPPGEEYHPVVWLSWFDAVAYAEWAGKRTIRYVDPADEDLPKLQKPTVYLEHRLALT